MTFEPREKKASIAPKLSDGTIDTEKARQVTNDLVKKMLTEERYHDKEKSFHMAKTGRRDVVVLMSVCVRNSVDGKIVLGDDESKGFERFDARDMYKYKTFEMLTVEFPARNMPGGKEYIGKGLMTAFNKLCQWLMTIGALRG